MLENTETIEGILISLHRSGWSIGSAAFVTIGVSRMWVVSGHNRENLFRTEGDSRSAANRVRRLKSRFSRNRTRRNPGGCFGRADRRAQNAFQNQAAGAGTALRLRSTARAAGRADWRS
jgi:hypothetical protein